LTSHFIHITPSLLELQEEGVADNPSCDNQSDFIFELEDDQKKSEDD